MSTLSISDVIDEIIVGLQAVPELAEWSITFGPDATGNEKVIEIGNDPISWTEEIMGLGSTSRLEEYSIPCRLFYAEPGTGDDNASRKAALDGALVTFAAVETYMNANQSDSHYMVGEVKSGEVEFGPFDGTFKGYYAAISFVLSIQASKTP